MPAVFGNLFLVFLFADRFAHLTQLKIKNLALSIKH